MLLHTLLNDHKNDKIKPGSKIREKIVFESLMVFIPINVFWHLFLKTEWSKMWVMKKYQKIHLHINAKEVNSVLACAATLLLTGVPQVVCESVITGVVCSFKRSIRAVLPWSASSSHFFFLISKFYIIQPGELFFRLVLFTIQFKTTLFTLFECAYPIQGNSSWHELCLITIII